MKKFVAKFMLILILLRIVFQVNIFEVSFAATNNWDFSTPASYTLSNTTSFTIT
jgi:hypothetical protein